jgi:hypothetical protein
LPKDVLGAELEGSLSRVVTRLKQHTAELLAHLAELDARRLYLAHGFGSMFSFCVEHLGFSEDEAAKRIHASRTARQYPAVFALVHEGALTPSTVNLIAPHLNAHNEAEPCALASGRSKRTLEELPAARYPRADVAAGVRKLPGAKPPAAASLTVARPSVRLTEDTKAEPFVLHGPAAPTRLAAPCPCLAPVPTPSAVPSSAKVSPASPPASAGR